MRILIYGLNFAPELTGIGKYSGEMAAFLAQKGHEVRVVTTPPYYPQWRIMAGYSGAAYTTEQWQGVTVYRCPLWLPRQRNVGQALHPDRVFSLSGQAEHPLGVQGLPYISDRRTQISGFQRILYLASFALSSLPVALAQIRWRPERVIVLAPSIFNAPAALGVARLSGAKCWLHIQDFELDAALRMRLLPSQEGLGLFIRLAQSVEGLLYRAFDRVSTISQRMLARLGEKGVPPARRVLFPNWVDAGEIYPINGYNGLRQEFALPDGCQLMLYAGNIGVKQGLEVLVEAARRLAGEKSLLFLLCGEGAARAALEAAAQGLPNVRFLPLQPVKRLNELLNLAAIHILPQAASAADLVMPSKLAGMLASGRPVIVTANPGTELAEVMADLGIVIPAGDPGRLAEAIRDLARQPDLQAELGRRGRAFVEATWAKELVLGKFVRDLEAL